MQRFRIFMRNLAFVVLMPVFSPAFAEVNQVLNGGFETGLNPGRFRTVPTGALVGDQWQVTQGNVDHIGSFWRSAEGYRSLDLNGTQAGEIGQTFPTQIGKTYTVHFALAGNPGNGPLVKTVQVSAGDNLQVYSFDVSGRSIWNMGWEEQIFTFTATTTTSTLRFTSLVAGNAGPALDNVRVLAGQGELESLGGNVTGMSVTEVECVNDTTGQRVTIRSHESLWDCQAVGLKVESGDSVVMRIQGTATSTGNTQKTQIEFTAIPAWGSSQNLQGRVVNINPVNFKVAVFIKVGSLGWWTKPFWSQPLSPIRADSTWEVDVTTGGQDAYATEYAAYLVPNGYNPPLLSGQQALPAELEQSTVAKVQTIRTPR